MRAGASIPSASLLKMSTALKAKTAPKSIESIPCLLARTSTTCHAAPACGTGPRFWFFFHLERVCYFSERISWVLGTQRGMACSFSRK